MALGTNYSRISRKTDLIIQIQLMRLDHGMSVIDAKESTTNYRRKRIDELLRILKDETNKKDVNNGN